MSRGPMEIPFHQVDAFAARPFTGNPAAVCPLLEWLPQETMQAIAGENNLSETAFLVPAGDGGDHDYSLRWFTPTTEVDLCGHATLASGCVVLGHLRPGSGSVTFSSRSGLLRVSDDGGGILRMELPADERAVVEPDPATAALLEATIGVRPTLVLGGPTWIAVLDSAAQVAAARPHRADVARLDPPYLNITAAGDPGSGVDFVSRYFAPGSGIDEDPVTGSAHCALAPFWAGRLGRERLLAEQLSRRGGRIDCELAGADVVLRGPAVEVIRGTLHLPDGRDAGGEPSGT